jgi:hypothetical protein
VPPAGCVPAASLGSRLLVLAAACMCACAHQQRRHPFLLALAAGRDNARYLLSLPQSLHAALLSWDDV